MRPATGRPDSSTAVLSRSWGVPGEPGDQAQQAGLADPTRSQQAGDLTTGQVEVERVEHHPPAIAQRRSVEMDRGGWLGL